MTTAGQPVPISRGSLAITTVLTRTVGVGVMAQGLLAGLFLDVGGNPRAHDVHEALGPLLVVLGLAAVVVSRLRLGGTAAGRKVSFATMGLTAALAVEDVLGIVSSDHPALLALHIPVAIGLFGLYLRAALSLRTLRSSAPRTDSDHS